MKKIITVLAILLTTLSFGQTNRLNGKATFTKIEEKFEHLKIEVTVDSEEEIKSTFSTEDIKQILEEASENEKVSFKITCNGENASTGFKSSASYSVKGNTNDKDAFIRNVEKIRNAAIKYFKNKA